MHGSVSVLCISMNARYLYSHFEHICECCIFVCIFCVYVMLATWSYHCIFLVAGDEYVAC